MPTSRLSTYQLTRMRRTQNSSLPDTCTVRRPSKVKNEAGGTIDTLVDVYTAIPVHAQPRVLREIKEDEVGGIIQAGVRWVCRFEFGVTVKLDDLLVVTETSTGRIYKLQVTSELSPQSYGTAYGVQCIRVE